MSLTKKDVDHMFDEGAKKLDATHPNKTTVKRSVTRVLNDLNDLRKSSPVEKKISVFTRLGSMLKSVAYRSTLVTAIVGGGSGAFLSFATFIYFLAVRGGNLKLKLFASSIATLLSAKVWKWGVSGSITQARVNLRTLEKATRPST